MDSTNSRCYQSILPNAYGDASANRPSGQHRSGQGSASALGDAVTEKQVVASAVPVPKTPTQSLTNIAAVKSTLEIDRQLIISNRSLVKEAPGYAWFHQSAIAPAASKAYIVQLLIELCDDYKIDWAQISCNKVFDLLNRPFVLPVSREDLLECLVNEREVKHLLAIPEHRYHKPSAAPTVIQSWWRMMKREWDRTYKGTRKYAQEKRYRKLMNIKSLSWEGTDKLTELQAIHPKIPVWGIHVNGKLQEFYGESISVQLPSIATDAPCTISGLAYATEASSDNVIVATACMFVEPDGRVILLGVCDQAYDTRQNPRLLGPTCVMYPAQSCSSTELQQKACAVAEHTYKESGLFGFVTVEFTFGSSFESRGLRIIADYSESCSGLQMLMLATGTLYNQGNFVSVASKPERRELAYTDQIPWVDKVAVQVLMTAFAASDDILKDLRHTRVKKYLLPAPELQPSPEQIVTVGQAPAYTNVELLFTSIPSAHLHLGNPSWNNVPDYDPILPTLKFKNPRIQRGLTTAEYLRIMEHITDEIDEAERDQRVWQNVHVLRSGIVHKPRVQEPSDDRAARSPSPPPLTAAKRASDFMGPVPSARRRASAALVTPKVAPKPAKKLNNRPQTARGKLLQEHLSAGSRSVVRQVVSHLFEEA
ncbi:hypothetical protein HDU87_002147 [Geranomyces variabilis]|uniref:Uncharacterized protein n=1 Tax=Geranomyces variabilis TaxID=109894 RepID=A0AAD5TLM8_9FUNG|nr:hypothetical protein HDU87_002147 [Geranomyces variabilis]